MSAKVHKYTVLGFPVLILNPVFKKAFGDDCLDIDHKKFVASVFMALIYKPSQESILRARMIVYISRERPSVKK